MGDFLEFSPSAARSARQGQSDREQGGSGVALSVKKNLSEINDPNSAPLTRLHNEILSFCENLDLTEEDLNTRDEVVSEITDIAKQLWGEDVQVHMFGSQATGTATRTSDVDLTILGCDCPADDTVPAMVAIADIIKARDLASYLEIIPNAKVPIIKMDHKKCGISLDICCNEATGIQGASIVAALSRDYPPFKYLMMVLKLYLAKRQLHETYSGGVGSFVLSMMVLSFLQQRQRIHEVLHAQAWNLGSLLLDFFNLYGCTFNYNRAVLSLHAGGRYLDKTASAGGGTGGMNKPPMLSIENPMDPSGPYIGENSFLMPKIRRSFEHSLQLLTIALAKNGSSKPLLSTILS
jgi:non-canonical poly(A) RNA polymerase PAPD5/7